MNIVSEILEILFDGLTYAATHIPQALGQAITNFLLESTTTEGVTSYTGLTGAGQVVVAFAGVSLALSLVYLGINFVLSWGKNR